MMQITAHKEQCASNNIKKNNRKQDKNKNKNKTNDRCNSTNDRNHCAPRISKTAKTKQEG